MHHYGSGASSFCNREENDEAKHFFLCMENSPWLFQKQLGKKPTKHKVLFRMETGAYCSENAGHIIRFFINAFGINYNYHCVHNVPYTKNSQQFYLLVKVKL